MQAHTEACLDHGPFETRSIRGSDELDPDVRGVALREDHSRIRKGSPPRLLGAV